MTILQRSLSILSASNELISRLLNNYNCTPTEIFCTYLQALLHTEICDTLRKETIPQPGIRATEENYLSILELKKMIPDEEMLINYAIHEFDEGRYIGSLLIFLPRFHRWMPMDQFNDAICKYMSSQIGLFHPFSYLQTAQVASGVLNLFHQTTNVVDPTILARMELPFHPITAISEELWMQTEQNVQLLRNLTAPMERILR